jgi:hypothetical protein
LCKLDKSPPPEDGPSPERGVSATAPSAGPLPFLASDNRGMPKTCSRCGLEKPLRDFYRQAGLEFTCKDYPKSDSGRRTIGLPRSVVDLLTEHLSKAAKASTSSRPVWSPASSVEFPPPALESCGQSRHPGATGLAPLAPHSRRATDPLRMAGIQHRSSPRVEGRHHAVSGVRPPVPQP